MAKQLQIRRGSTAENNAFTGAVGELTYDTGKKGIRLHDGSKAGGYEVPVLVAVQNPSPSNGYTWYRKYSDGWVEQGGVYNVVNTGGWQAPVTITLPIKMGNKMYTVTWTNGWNDYTDDCPTIKSRTTTSFIAARPLCSAADTVSSWMVSGIAK